MSLLDIFVLCCFVFGALSALAVAFWPNILHAAVALIFSLMSVAGMYAALGADFLTAVQFVVYIGATIVVIIFAVMMTPQIYEKRFLPGAKKYILPTVLATALFSMMWVLFVGENWALRELPIREPISRAVGAALIDKFAFPFEYMAVLLLMGLVGAVVVARSKDDEDEKS